MPVARHAAIPARLSGAAMHLTRPFSIGACMLVSVVAAAPGSGAALRFEGGRERFCLRGPVPGAEPASGDLPLCRPDWPQQIVSIGGYRRSQAISAWLANGVRVHHLRIVEPRDRLAGAGGGDPASKADGPGEGPVQVTVSFFGGELLESQANRGVSMVACSAWDELSTADLAPACIPSAMEGRDLQIEAVAGPDLIQLRLRGPARDIEAGMRIVAALLRAPRVTGAVMDAATSSAIRELTARASSRSQLLAGAIVDALYSPCEARVRPPTPDQVLAITGEQAQRWLDEHILAAPVEASIVGDVSVDDAMRLAGGYLSVLPNRPRIHSRAFQHERAIRGPQYPLRRELTQEIEPGTAVVIVGFPGADGPQVAELRTMRLAARVFGARAAAALGRAGFADAQRDAAAIPGGPYPGFGVVAYSVRTESDRAEVAAELLEDVVRDLATAGVSPDEIESARAEVLAGFARVERQPRYWSQLLARIDASGIDLDEVADGAGFYESLNAETVAAAIRRNVDGGRTLRLIIRSDRPGCEEPEVSPVP